jgi:DNA-binding transcriptional MerR regulator
MGLEQGKAKTWRHRSGVRDKKEREVTTLELVTIGQFSKVSWLSIKALRLYDELGLLEPAFIDPRTGYRYYEPAQASRARAIALLRSLDMPLLDIKDLLAESDPDKLRS